MKRRKTPDDPYLDVIDHFNRKGVRYVVVGMAGINYYGKDARQIFGTMDYDIFVEPALKNVDKALNILKSLGFNLGTSEGTLNLTDLKGVVGMRQTLMATTPYGWMVELLLEVSGFPFSELSRDAMTFTVEDIPIRVGKLAQLIQSKRMAHRPKDRQFLKRYQALLDEGESQGLE